MIQYLQSQKSQDFSSVVTSETFTIPTSVTAGTTATATGGTIVKNGAPSGVASTTVSPGDVLALRLTTDAATSTTTIVQCIIGDKKYVFAATTKDPTVSFPLPAFEGQGPLDGILLPDGTPYTKLAATDRSNLEVINVVTGAPITTVPLTTDTARLDTTHKDLSVVVDYFNDRLFLVESATKNLLNFIDLPAGSRPSCVAYSFDRDAQQTFTWVACSGTNRILKIDLSTRTVVSTILVGRRPMGISIDVVDTTIWVANFDDNTISRIDSTGAVTDTYNVGKGPLETRLDSAGNFWCVCSGENYVYSITKSTGSIANVQVGAYPWDLEIVGSVVYVTNSWDGTISKINANTKTIMSTFPICAIPGAIVKDTTGALWVASFSEYKLYKLIGDTVTSSMAIPKIPFSLSLNGTTELWIASMYPRMPVRTYSQDYLPTRMSFLRNATAVLNTKYTSEQQTITGLANGISMPLVIPSLAEFGLIKNGIAVPSGITTVTNGDHIQVEITTPAMADPGSNQRLIMYYGQQEASWDVSIASVASDPAQYTFNEVSEVTISDVITSNEITIAGMTAGVVTSLVTSRGSVVLNGTDTGQPAVSITNGDKVAIKMTAAATPGTLVTTNVTAGNRFEEWSIQTAYDVNNVDFVSIGAAPVIPNITNVERDILVTTSFTVSGILKTLDPFFPKNVLLLTGNNFVDVMGHVVTPTNVSATGIFGFAGTGLMDMGTSPDWNLGDSFTIEFFMDPTAYPTFVLDSTTPPPGYRHVISYETCRLMQIGEVGSPSGLAIDYLHSGGIAIYSLDDPTNRVEANVPIEWRYYSQGYYDPTWHQVSSPLIPVGVWSYITITLKNGHAAIYKNGALIGSGNLRAQAASAQESFKIGDSTDPTTTFAYRGYLQHLRVTKDCRYTSAFEMASVRLPHEGSHYSLTTGTPNVEYLSIGDYPDTDLFINGSDTPVKESIVHNGDNVVVRVRSPKKYVTTMERSVFFNKHILKFNVSTLPFLWPDPFVFIEMYDSVPRSEYTSNIVTVSGLPDAGSTVPIKYDYGTILVNGVAKTSPAVVKNGDTVQWVLKIGGPWGGVINYPLNVNNAIFYWTFHNVALTGHALQDHWIFSERMRSTYPGWIDNPSGQRENIRLSVANRLVLHSQKSEQLHTWVDKHNVSTWSIGVQIPFSRTTKTTNLAQLPTFSDIRIMNFHESLGFNFVNPTFAFGKWTPGSTVKLGISAKESLNTRLIERKSVSSIIYDRPTLFYRQQWSSLEAVLKGFEQKFNYSDRVFLSFPATGIDGRAEVSANMMSHIKAVDGDAKSIAPPIPSKEIITNVVSAIHYAREAVVVKGNDGSGIGNTYITKRFTSAGLALQEGTAVWKFTSVQAIPWGDGTFIWTGDCATYKPFAFKAYISGG